MTSDEQWADFIEGCRLSRDSTRDPAIPTQVVAMRDGQQLGYGTMEVNAQGIASACIALMTAFACDEVFICMDSYYAGEQKLSPHTGEKWVEGEMSFDFQENPDTVVKEGLMFWTLGDHGQCARSNAMVFTRTEDGFEWGEVMDIDADTAEGIHAMLHHYYHASQNVYGTLMDKVREAAQGSAFRQACLDSAGLSQMNELFPYFKFDLIAYEDGSERTKVLRERHKKPLIPPWVGGEKVDQ